jgi:AcrR family transcriptional regulator
MKQTTPVAQQTKSSVRDRIFWAAASLISAGGTAAASARAICKKARITAPTLYRHFGDLDSLYDELLTLMYIPEAQAHPGREHTDPSGMIEYMWDCCVGAAIRNPGLVDLKSQLSAAGRTPESMLQFYGRLEASFEELGKRKLLNYSPKVAAAMYWGAAIGMARMIASSRHGGPDCSALAAESLREAVWVALIREEPAVRAAKAAVAART